jgi:glycosyltransferase involved in cell wall biosynthesis
VPPGEVRPDWSVMVPTCDDAELLPTALRSVLEQDPGPERLQIEVIDDGSVDADVAALVHELAGDRVSVVRHPHRWGAPATFTHALQRSRGRWVHVLHADDHVLPGFYAAYEAALLADPDAAMAVSRSWFVDDDGARLGLSGELAVDADDRLIDAELVIALDHPINFVAVVVARAAVEEVGGFDPALPHANDWELWARLAHHGPVAVVDGEHACYRRHEGSDTTRLQGSMTYLTDLVAAVRIVADRLGTTDPDAADRVLAHNHRRLAAYALDVGATQAAAGHHRLAATSAAWAARLDPRPETARAAARLVRTAARNRLGG